MGVYLYGELMAHEDPVQQLLAEVCFQAVKKEMDRGCYNTVHQMLYGNKTNGYLYEKLKWSSPCVKYAGALPFTASCSNY